MSIISFLDWEERIEEVAVGREVWVHRNARLEKGGGNGREYVLNSSFPWIVAEIRRVFGRSTTFANSGVRFH